MGGGNLPARKEGLEEAVMENIGKKSNTLVIERKLPFKIPDDCPFCRGPLMVRDKGLFCKTCEFWVVEFSEGWPGASSSPG